MVRFALALIAAVGMATTGAALLSAQTPGPSLAEQQRSLLSAREQSERARQRSNALRRQAEAASNDADRIASEAAALAARIQAAEADIKAARTRIAIVTQLQQRQRARLA